MENTFQQNNNLEQTFPQEQPEHVYVDHRNHRELKPQGELVTIAGSEVFMEPVQFEYDCPEPAREWILGKMNGEEPKVSMISTHMFLRMMLEAELLVDKAQGVLDEGLELLFDGIEEALGTKVGNMFFFMDKLDSEEALYKKQARHFTELARARARTKVRIKALLPPIYLHKGDQELKKDGGTIYRIETPAGKTSCSRKKKDKIVWPNDEEPTARLKPATKLTRRSGYVYIKVMEAELPLDFDLMRLTSVKFVPDNDACLKTSASKLPEGTYTKPDYTVRKPRTPKSPAKGRK